MTRIDCCFLEFNPCDVLSPRVCAGPFLTNRIYQSDGCYSIKVTKDCDFHLCSSLSVSGSFHLLGLKTSAAMLWGAVRSGHVARNLVLIARARSSVFEELHPVNSQMRELGSGWLEFVSKISSSNLEVILAMNNILTAASERPWHGRSS